VAPVKISIGEYETATYPPNEPPNDELIWEASLETGDFSEFDYPFDGGSHNPQNNGQATVSISKDYASSGTYSIKHTANSEGDNTRVFQMPRRPSDGQWGWDDSSKYFSAEYFIPNLIHVGSNWNVFQFKSKELGQTQNRNEPFFSFNLFDQSDGRYRLRVYHKPDGTNESGFWLSELPAQPRVGVGQWFEIKARLKPSPLGAKNGELDVWLNGVQTHNIKGVDTRYAGNSTQTWSVNNYGKSLTRPSIIYTDNHRVTKA
jgi:hypothetical protein